MFTLLVFNKLIYVRDNLLKNLSDIFYNYSLSFKEIHFNFEITLKKR